MNFHLAAFTYLYEWVCYDRFYLKDLAFNKSHSQPSPTVACKQLVGVATHYTVIRGFKIEEKEVERLMPVWDALRKMEPPNSPKDAKELVRRFVAELQPTYGQNLLSAASKILWMRFRTSIVIYDSIVSDWMCNKGGCARRGSYDDFYDAWQRNFEQHEAAIRTVCDELKGISAARKFFDPGDIGEQAFDDAVSSRWFAERVFDHALLNAETIENPTV